MGNFLCLPVMEQGSGLNRVMRKDYALLTFLIAVTETKSSQGRKSLFQFITQEKAFMCGNLQP